MNFAKLLGLCAAATCSAQTYTVTDLGSLGGASFAHAVNAKGQVAGASETSISPPFYRRAFFWDPDTGIQDLGTLGGNDSFGLGINDYGQVVGASTTGTGETHAFLWTPGNSQLQDLGTLAGGDSTALGINNLGQVAGYSGILYNYHAVVWDGLGIVDLGQGAANAINNVSQVAGELATFATYTDAFLAELGEAPRDLGTLGGFAPFSRALALNDSGEVAGVSSTPRRHHGFFYDSRNGMQDLGALGEDSFSQAFGLNNSGQVVGVSTTLGEVSFAVLWDEANGIRKLDDLLPPGSMWRLQEAKAINDAGQIAGWGYNDSPPRAVLLMPVYR
jgi:probable HAF family extracellular repeat protein